MKGSTIAYAQRQEELRQIDKIKKLIINQTVEHPLGIPHYYGVAYYGKSFDGDVLSSDDYRKRWDINEVRKTQRFVTRKIRQCFGKEVPVWWMINRHDSYENAEGDSKKGSFHSDIYIGEISDNALESPSPALLKLFYHDDSLGVPIESRAVDIEGKKLLLLEACIRQAKWIGRHPNALTLNAIPPEEVEQTFHYGLKDLNSLEDLNKVIDWDNSSFYTPNKE